jgi:hypothetical protein
MTTLEVFKSYAFEERLASAMILLRAGRNCR